MASVLLTLLSLALDERIAKILKCYQDHPPPFNTDPTTPDAKSMTLFVDMHHPLEFRFDHDLKAEIVSARPLLRAEFVDDNYFRPNSTCKELFMPHLMQVYGGEALIRPTITEIELQDAHRPFVTVVAHTKIEWEERRWPFNYFPFDEQVAHLWFEAAAGYSTSLTNCDRGHFRAVKLTEPSAYTERDPTRPVNATPVLYQVKGSDIAKDEAAAGNVIRGAWNINSARLGDGWLEVYRGYRAQTSCYFDVHIRRHPTMFISKSIAIDTIIVTAALGALFANPAVPPLLGCRLGLLITGLLINVNKLSTSSASPVGLPAYPIATDFLGLINICVILSALVETVFVGWCHRFGHLHKCGAEIRPTPLVHPIFTSRSHRICRSVRRVIRL